MKYMIITDLEGPSGVERFNQTRGTDPFHIVSARYLTQEVNAAIQGIYDADNEAIIHVIDGHGSATGILKEKMDSRAVYIRRGKPFSPWKDLTSYRGIMYVGQHAMGGTANANLCHTFSLSVIYKRLNGIYVGEFGVHAAMAGYLGVPVIFIAGDDKAVAEARALIPNIYYVTTKWGEGWQKARHEKAEEINKQIRLNIAEACRHIDSIQPLYFEPPYAYETRYTEPYQAPECTIPGVAMTQVDVYTVKYRSDNLLNIPV